MSEGKAREIALSGIQPSGELHLGNNLGAMRNWVTIQDTYRPSSRVVDRPALTRPDARSRMGRGVRDLAASLVACGIVPARPAPGVPLPEHTGMTRSKDNSEEPVV